MKPAISLACANDAAQGFPHADFEGVAFLSLPDLLRTDISAFQPAFMICTTEFPIHDDALSHARRRS